MKGIILAAGRGSRMGNMTLNIPKCLINLFGKPLLNYQIEALKNANIHEIGVVCGYQQNKIKDSRISLKMLNPEWETTNMVSTLLCATHWLEQDTCLVSYADIFYDSSIIQKLLATKSDIAIAYDTNFKTLWSARFENPLEDLETFIFNSDNILQDIGDPALAIEKIQGQYMGLLKITPTGWNKITNILKDFKKNALNKLDMTKLLQHLIKNNIAIEVVPYNELWGEIDQVSDLELYESWNLPSSLEIKGDLLPE
jgi:choline kinase